MDLSAYAAFFSSGSFVSVVNQVLWLAAFFIGVTGCTIGISLQARSSAQALPSACIAGLISYYNALYLLCFAEVVLCSVQVSAASLALWILGYNKRVDRLPAASGRWCRRVVFIGIIYCAVSFATLICILDFFVFIRVSMFSCLGLAKYLVIAMDSIAACVAVVLFIVGSYVALYCH